MTQIKRMKLRLGLEVLENVSEKHSSIGNFF
jgi:hypothetical protein